MNFDEAIRGLARSNGHKVADNEPVQVEMTGEWSGYSEYTITNTWDQFTVRCGSFERVYSNEEENRSAWPMGEDEVTPKTALAKLFDELAV